MKIYDLRINGNYEPTIGMDFTCINCSWKVKEAYGKKQHNACILVSLDSDYTTICYKKEAKHLSSIAEPIEMNLSPCTRYFIRVQIESETGEEACADTWFETGKMQSRWQGQWITTAKEDTFHPEFRRKFSLLKNIKSARLYVSGLGLFEAFINNKKAGKDYLAPFNTDYRDGIQYCSYDVADLLSKQNELTVILGNGWYKGRLGYTGMKQVFGNQFQMIAELIVEYEDGQKEVISTDSGWEYRGSKIVWSDIYDGEFWDDLLWESVENPWKPITVADKQYSLLERYSLPLMEQEQLLVKEIIWTDKNEIVLDFGQNFAGYVVFTGDMKKGEVLKLQFGEVLQDHNFYNENYRTAKAEFVYRASGDNLLVRPHFTYYGFQYVKVEGISDINLGDFYGVVIHSSMKRTGYFKSSDELLNRLYENTVWGMKSNFVDLPTDCPQRDERLGWTGDAQIFSGAASYHMDTKAFYDKYLIDLRKDQLKNNGKVAMYLPNLQQGLCSSIWGDAATVIPTVLYKHFGDKKLLKKEYPLMRDWVEFVRSEDEKRGCKNLWDYGFHLGDWLALDGVTDQSMVGATDPYYIASVYYYGSAMMLSDAARVLEYSEDEDKYKLLAENIKNAVLYHYFTPYGKLSVDTQTAYYLALYFGLYRSKEVLIKDLKKRIKKDCYQITSGFASAPILCNVLADAGLKELAYDFLFYRGYPGWLYEVELEATTVWERWNSLLPDGHISSTGMNSLNHYAYGTVAEFLYRHIGGIQPEKPGFQEARISPKLTPYLKWAECSYDSAAGKYRVRWEIKKDGYISLYLDIPFNAEAIVELPDSGMDEFMVQSGSYEYTYKPLKDYRYIFDENSRLEQIRKNESAMKFAEKSCKSLAEMMKNGDKEVLSKSLIELSQSKFSGLPQNEMERAISQILTIKNE